MGQVKVRYIVHDVEQAVEFYTSLLGFDVKMNPAPGFAALEREGLTLLLNRRAPEGQARRCQEVTLRNREVGTASSWRSRISRASLNA